MRPPKRSLFCEADLAWFDLGKYQPLAELDHLGWANLIFSRLQVQRVGPLLLNEDRLDLLRCLQEDPLSNFGHYLAGAADSLGKSLLDTATVRPLRVRDVQRIDSLLREQNGSPEDYVDEATVSTVGAHDVVHLALHLGASDQQLISDFKRFLAKLRMHKPHIKRLKYETAPAKWASQHVVPYFDLKLFERLEYKVIPQAILASLLFPGSNPYKREKSMRNLPLLSETVFSEDTLSMMMHLSRKDL